VTKSIYRGWRNLPYDVQVQDHADKGATENIPAPPPVHLRRMQPVTVLLPRTREWIASLPEAVRPHILAAQFARIANLICISWDDSSHCREYFDELLVHRRNGRKGFPVAVLRDLNILYSYYVGMHNAFDRSRK